MGKVLVRSILGKGLGISPVKGQRYDNINFGK